MRGGTTGMMTCFHARSPWASADDAARTHALSLAALLDVSTTRRSHMSALSRRMKWLGPIRRRSGIIGQAASSGVDSAGRHSNPGWRDGGR